MAFIYEVVPQDDIKKYNIEQLYEHYLKQADTDWFYDGLSGRNCRQLIDQETFGF